MGAFVCQFDSFCSDLPATFGGGSYSHQDAAGGSYSHENAAGGQGACGSEQLAHIPRWEGSENGECYSRDENLCRPCGDSHGRAYDPFEQHKPAHNLGAHWVDLPDSDSGGGSITVFIACADPYVREHRAAYEGVFVMWKAKVKMVGQDEVDMWCPRMEYPILGEMHSAWFSPAEDRPAVAVSSLTTGLRLPRR